VIFKRDTEPDERWRPLPTVVHSIDAAVVELVADRERYVQIVVEQAHRRDSGERKLVRAAEELGQQDP
jgi:hypothetical protein